MIIKLDNSAPSKEPDRKKPLYSLQVGRGIAALMVVAFHATGVFNLPKYWGARPFGNAFAPGNSGVSFFFTLSGFIIAYAHWSDIGQPARLYHYAWNRVTRIYPLYWIVSLGTALFVLLLSKRVLTAGNKFLSFLGNLTLLPFDGQVAVVPVAWTLFHEVIFYIFFALLLINRRAGLIVGTVWGLACASAIFWVQNNDEVKAVIFGPINLLFFFGISAALWSKYGSLRAASYSFVVGISSYIAIWLWQVLSHPYADDKLSEILQLGYGVASALAVAGLAVLERHRSVRFPKIALFLGNASYSIYLVHFMIVSAACKVLVRYSFIPQSVALVAVMLAGIVGGCICHLALEKPMLSWCRRRCLVSTSPNNRKW